MVDVTLVKKLREATGAGMMDCKKALSETNDNYDDACDWLRKKGIAAAAKKGDRIASEGVIAQKTFGNQAVVIELNSETDFVAKNTEFQKLATQIVDTIANNDDVSEANNLQISENNASIADSITNAISVIGENIQFRRFEKISNNNGFITSYIHSKIADDMGRIGVLVSVNSDNNSDDAQTLAKQIAMHIAASKPIALDQNGVPAAAIEKEKEIFSEQAKASGKPAEIIEKMIEGRIRKFYAEVTLLDQAFVMDGKTQVKEVIANFNKEHNANFSIENFIRYEIGEGIEKKEEDFAKEVESIAAGS